MSCWLTTTSTFFSGSVKQIAIDQKTAWILYESSLDQEVFCHVWWTGSQLGLVVGGEEEIDDIETYSFEKNNGSHMEDGKIALK